MMKRKTTKKSLLEEIYFFHRSHDDIKQNITLCNVLCCLVCGKMLTAKWLRKKGMNTLDFMNTLHAISLYSLRLCAFFSHSSAQLNTSSDFSRSSCDSESKFFSSCLSLLFDFEHCRKYSLTFFYEVPSDA
jgi:hypothetical protein